VSLSKEAVGSQAMLAETLVRLKREPEAIAAYQNLLSAREKADDRIHLARLLSGTGRSEDAESILTQGLEAAAKQKDAKTRAADERSLRLALADLYESTGRPAKAEATLRQVVEQDPDALGARRSLSRALSEQGKLEESARQLEAVLERDPDDAEALAALKSFP